METMKDRVCISVIINCYNGEKYLKEAIDSIYAQSYKNIEIIISDDESSDTSIEKASNRLKKTKIKYLQVVPRHWRCPLLLRAHFL